MHRLRTANHLLRNVLHEQAQSNSMFPEAFPQPQEQGGTSLSGGRPNFAGTAPPQQMSVPYGDLGRFSTGTPTPCAVTIRGKIYVGTAAKISMWDSRPRLSVERSSTGLPVRADKLKLLQVDSSGRKEQTGLDSRPAIHDSEVREPNSFSILHVCRNAECAVVPAHSWARNLH